MSNIDSEIESAIWKFKAMLDEAIRQGFVAGYEAGEHDEAGDEPHEKEARAEDYLAAIRSRKDKP